MRININSQDLFKKVLSRFLNKDINQNINGISIDSRKIKKDDVFICLQGQKNHGNDFIDEDLLSKVSLIITDKKYTSDKVYLVKDSKVFLGSLAMEFRGNLKAKFIIFSLM